jgi:thymidylate kinase
MTLTHSPTDDEGGAIWTEGTWLGDLLQSEPFRTALHQESDLYDQVHGHFVALGEAWRSCGVEWICFKSAGIDPAFPYTSDNFDILIRPESYVDARDRLLALGYVELRNIEEPQKWLFRLFVGGESVSAIHLHTRVGWGQGFMIEPEIWRRRQLSEDDAWTWVPGPEDSVLINVAHAVFENKELNLHDLMKVRHSIGLGVDWEYIDFVAAQRGWTKGLDIGLASVARLEEQLFADVSVPWERRVAGVKRIEGSRMLRRYWSALAAKPAVLPFGLSFALSKLLFFDKLYADKHVTFAKKPLLATLALARGFKGQIGAHPQNSALITLSGMDGSGKTAQALALADVFSIAELRAEVRWARFGATPIVYSLSRLMYGRSQDRDVDDGSSKPFSRTGLSLKVWAGLSAADYAIWLLQIRFRLLRGEIVIADRYLCDMDVELSQRLQIHPELREAIASVLAKIAPSPQSAYLLRIDHHLAAERAVPDGGDASMPEQMRLYDTLSDRYRLRVLDAGLPFDAASAELARDALREYLNNYGMIGNLLYFSNPWQLNRPEKGTNAASKSARFAAVR